MQAHETVLMSKVAFDALPEYSMSNPAGTTIGKQWKMGWGQPDGPLTWYLCEYVEHDDPGFIGIRRKVIQLCPEREK